MPGLLPAIGPSPCFVGYHSLRDSSLYFVKFSSFTQPLSKRPRRDPYVVPTWEVRVAFDPLTAWEKFKNRVVQWVSISRTSGEASVPDPSPPSVGEVLVAWDTKRSPQLLIRDPDSFIAGEIHPEVWDRMSKDLANWAEIMGWINNMVSVHDYLQHFKGQYAGIAYDSDFPVSRGNGEQAPTTSLRDLC